MEKHPKKDDITLLSWYKRTPYIPGQFVKGQIVALELYSLDDEHFFPEKIDPEKATNPSIILPAIISSVKFNPDLITLYDIVTIWRTNNLELMGYVEIPNLAVWRHIKNPPTIDTIPKWFLKTIDKYVASGEKKVFGIDVDELCYLGKNEKGQLEFVYRWRKK